jgi:hypothetical protein
MADITKCLGKDCDKKDECYRYIAPKGINQAYLEVDDPKVCHLFWDLKNMRLKIENT